MTEIFTKPDNNPWRTLARVTGEKDQMRLHGFVAVVDALGALVYRGEAGGKIKFGNREIMDRLSVFLNQDLPGRVEINVYTIREFLNVNGDPDQYSGGVVGACTGITDRLDPSEEALAQARRILNKL